MADSKVLTAFVSILAELSSTEARILEYVFPLAIERRRLEERANSTDPSERNKAHEGMGPLDARLTAKAACGRALA